MKNLSGKALVMPALAAWLLAAGTPALAQESGSWNSSVQPGMELTTHLSEQLNIRFGVNRFSDATSPLARRPRDVATLSDDFTASALLDWEFAAGGLRVTGGALYGDLGWGSGTLDGWSRSQRDLERNGIEDVRTYIGLGWDADFGSEQRLGLQLDLGVAFEGVPVEEGTDGEFLRAQEDARLGQRFESFRYVPMFSAGVEYRF